MSKETVNQTGSLNDAQVAFLGLLAAVKTEEELAELKKVVAKHLMKKIREATKGEAVRLGVDSKGGYLKFAKENHKRTPYK